ncbi:MAG: outer membrane protein assembly factor BamB [Pseudomonadota bacterium]
MRRAIVTLAALSVSSLLSGCGIFGGGDDDEALQPAELLDVDETLRVRKRWSTKVGDDANDLRLGLSPVSDTIRAYAASRNGLVHGLEIDTGRKLWTARLDILLSAGPTVADGRVIVAGLDGDVVAIDAGDGKVLWQRNIAAEILAPPAVGGERVVLRSADGRLIALDASTGDEKWVIEEEVPDLSLRGTASPTLAANLVVCGFDNGRLMGVELLSGEVVWDQIITPPTGRSDLERLVDLDGRSIAVGRELYITGFQGQVGSLLLDSGQLLWTRELSSYHGPGVDWNMVFVSADGGDVVALSRANGVEQWRNRELTRRELTAPTPFGNAIAVGDLEGYLHFLDAQTGAVIARRRVDGARISTAPHAQGDLLLVQADSGVVAAYEVAVQDR